MKNLITAILFSVSMALSSEIDLHSPLWLAAHASNHEKIALIDSFISTGAFTSPYTGLIMLTQGDLDGMRACMDDDLWHMYSEIGSDTEIGVLMIGCAYKLGWFTR